MAWIKIAQTDQVPEGKTLRFDLNGRACAIFNGSGTFYAASAVCPHAKAWLDEGKVEGNIVTCPKHGWKWDLAAGKAVDNSGYLYQTYALKIEGEELWVDDGL